MTGQVYSCELSASEILYLQTALGDFHADSKRFPGAFNRIILNSLRAPSDVSFPSDALSRLTEKDAAFVHKQLVSPLMGLLSLLEFHLEPYRRGAKISAREFASMITLYDVASATFMELLPRSYPERARTRLNVMDVFREISRESSPALRTTLSRVEALCLDDNFRRQLFGSRRPEDSLTSLPEKAKIQFLFLETLRRQALATPALHAPKVILSPESLSRMREESFALMSLSSNVATPKSVEPLTTRGDSSCDRKEEITPEAPRTQQEALSVIGLGSSVVGFTQVQNFGEEPFRTMTLGNREGLDSF